MSIFFKAMIRFALLFVALVCPSQQRTFNPFNDGLELQEDSNSLAPEEEPVSIKRYLDS